jgi:broad specificity phosphatase PhoE
MSDTTTICTVRHGQTEYAVQQRYAGTLDIQLNKIGVEDAKHASNKLKGMKFDVVITSTLKRSIETAKLLLGNNVNFVQFPNCNERNYGTMQGLTADEVKLIEPKINFIEVGDDYHSLNPPQGETFEMLRKRAENLYKIILERYEGLTLLIVSHGVFLQQLHGLIRGLDWKHSLATNVQNLEFNKFVLRGTHLVYQSKSRLIDREQSGW